MQVRRVTDDSYAQFRMARSNRCDLAGIGLGTVVADDDLAAKAALGEQRQLVPPARRVEDDDPVRLRAAPRARRGHVVGDDQVHLLAGELARHASERARLRREADQHRGRLQGAPGGLARGVEAAGDPGGLGQDGQQVGRHGRHQHQVHRHPRSGRLSTAQHLLLHHRPAGFGYLQPCSRQPALPTMQFWLTSFFTSP